MERLYRYNSQRPVYNDRTFRLLISVPVGAYMVLYREEDNLWESFFDPGFWVGGIFSYGVCMLLLWLINRITKRLDRFCDWRQHTFLRTLYQFCWGIVATVVLTFLLATLFFLFFKIDIRDTDYISNDLPLIILLIVLANLYYLTYYLWLVAPLGYVPIKLVEDVLSSGKEIPGGESKENTRLLFLAQTDEGIIPLVQENIAVVFKQEEYIIIKTFDRQTFTVNQTVNQVFKELDGFHFFQVNPRWIVNYRICQKFRPGKNSKCFLELSAPVNNTVEVTRARVKAFKKWMNR